MGTLEIVLLVLLVLFLVGGFAVNHLIFIAIVVLLVVFLLDRRGGSRL